jgi:AcrR family transcriptional regulator
MVRTKEAPLGPLGSFGRRHRSAREAVAESQRARLIDGLVYAAASKGYTATTIADVVEQAGVSRRTFYEQFEDKEDCLVAACRLAQDFLTKRIREELRAAAPGSWREALEIGVRVYLATLAEEPEYAQVLHFEIFAASEKVRDWFAGLEEEQTRFFQMINATARSSDPAVGEMSREAAVMVAGGIRELVRNALRHGTLPDLPAASPSVARAVEALIAPRK